MNFTILLVLAIFLWGAFRILKARRKPNINHLPEQFVVFDLETTGLVPSSEQIIEIGAIKVNRSSDVHQTFQTLVRPSKKIPRKITQLTGITQKMVDAEGVTIEEAIKGFHNFVGDLPLVAYNAEFDMKFLQVAAMKQGFAFKNKSSCALRLARAAWPGRNSYKLSALIENSDESHRAIADCKRALSAYTTAADKLGARFDYESVTMMLTDSIPVNFDLPFVEFENKYFCFSGDFIYGTRAECEQAVILKNGASGNLTKKTDYLVIGSYASPEWLAKTGGRKIEKALLMRASTSKPQIISERHWLAHL